MGIIRLSKQMAPFVMLGWRNLWRQKRRSLVVISSIGIGIFAMIFSLSFSNGIMAQLVENTIGTSLGDIAIHRTGFQKSMKLEYNFSPDRRISELLQNNGAIKAYSPRVKIEGMIRSGEASRGVMIIGVDPPMEKKVSTIYHYTSRKGGGRYLSSSAGDEIIISRSLAEKLDLYIGDKAVIMLQDQKNEIVGVALEIVGLFETPMSRFDKSVVFMGIKKLQEITGLGAHISEITAIVSHESRVDAVKQYLAAGTRGRGIEVLSWKDMAPNLLETVQLINAAMLVFFFIIFITVIFSIANTLIMSIVERFHELGVMKCIGTRPAHVFFMVIFEAINLGLLGLIGGILIGIPLVLFLGYAGIDMSFAMESMRKWGAGSVIYPTVHLRDIVSASEIVLLTTVAAALYPAVKAARIKPLDALNYL